MNRLILIGNGFDLAHGLKTSYIDFIKWYIQRCFIDVVKEKYDDILIEVERNPAYNTNNIVANLAVWLESYFAETGDIGRIGEYYTSGSSNKRIYPFKIRVKSSFLQALLYQCKVQRWIDVEAIFYSELLSILKISGQGIDKGALIEDKERRLAVLNNEMAYLIEQLQVYLKSLPDAPYIFGYEEIFQSVIELDDLDSKTITEHLLAMGYQPVILERTQILTFNYTNTLTQYYPDSGDFTNSSTYINYIHGELTNKINPMIFGFGDELDDNYLLMEREMAKGYFKHIKSFWYFRTSRYRELVRFVDSMPYQILILGHSCGLSDRTMLHMLFEHSNCKSIKIYYHGDESENNYTDITYEIARHFKDKETMRERIVPLDRSINMPQVTKGSEQ